MTEWTSIFLALGRASLVSGCPLAQDKQDKSNSCLVQAVDDASSTTTKLRRNVLLREVVSFC